MAVLTLYPNAVKTSGNFGASASNIIGNTSTYATHTGSLMVNSGIYSTMLFQLSLLPANATISAIKATIIAKASASSQRSMYTIGVYKPSTGVLVLDSSNYNLSTVDGTIVVNFSSTNISDIGVWSFDNMEFDVTFLVTGTANVTTSWQKFWLDITYTVPTSGDPLFFGGGF